MTAKKEDGIETEDDYRSSKRQKSRGFDEHNPRGQNKERRANLWDFSSPSMISLQFLALFCDKHWFYFREEAGSSRMFLRLLSQIVLKLSTKEKVQAKVVRESECL